MKISKEAYCKMRQNAESDESFKKRFTTERSRPYDVRQCLRKYWKKNSLAFNMVSLVLQFASHSGTHCRFYQQWKYRWLLYCVTFRRFRVKSRGMSCTLWLVTNNRNSSDSFSILPSIMRTRLWKTSLGKEKDFVAEKGSSYFWYNPQSVCRKKIEKPCEVTGRYCWKI